MEEEIIMEKFMKEYNFKSMICNNGEWTAIDQNNNKWNFDKNSNKFINVEKSNPFNINNKVLDQIRTEFEDRWMDLEISIDNCQGCMDGLDEAFDELKLFRQIIAFLGGNIDNDYQKILDRAYERYKERDKKQEELNLKKDSIIEPLKIDFRKIVIMEDPYKDIITDMIFKINEITNKMRDQVDILDYMDSEN